MLDLRTPGPVSFSNCQDSVIMLFSECSIDLAFYLPKLPHNVLPANDRNPSLTTNLLLIQFVLPILCMIAVLICIENAALRVYQEQSSVNFQHVKGSQKLADVLQNVGRWILCYLKFYKVLNYFKGKLWSKKS